MVYCYVEEMDYLRQAPYATQERCGNHSCNSTIGRSYMFLDFSQAHSQLSCLFFIMSSD